MPDLPNHEVREILARLTLIQSAVGAAEKAPEKIPLIDPTENVKALVKLEMTRQDDLRDAEGERADALREMQEKYQEKLALAESRRIDALTLAESRRIDALLAAQQNAVALAAEKNAAQAATLGATTENLRSTIDSRITRLEQQQYQTGGRDIQRDVGKADMRWGIYLLMALPGIIATLLVLFRP